VELILNLGENKRNKFIVLDEDAWMATRSNKFKENIEDKLIMDK